MSRGCRDWRPTTSARWSVEACWAVAVALERDGLGVGELGQAGEHLVEQAQQVSALAGRQLVEGVAFEGADAGQETVRDGASVVGDLHQCAAPVFVVRGAPDPTALLQQVQ